MATTVKIPTPLRSFTANQDEVSASGATVRELIADLEKSYPGLGSRLLDERGNLRRYVNLFLNDEDVRFQQSLDTPVKEGDRLALVPAIAGGKD